MSAADPTAPADPMTPTDPTAVARAKPTWRDVADQARRWALAAVGLAVVVWGWRSATTALYVFGLALIGVGTLRAMRDRWVVGLAVAVTLAGAGVAGPWLGVRQAYEPVGVEAASSVDSHAHYVGTYRGTTVFVHDSSLIALGPDGTEQWVTELPDLHYVVRTSDDGFVVVLDRRLLGVDGGGAHVWSREHTSGDEFVALADGVLVERACTVDNGSASCMWTGIDAAQGDVRWEVSGAWGAAWGATEVMAWDDRVRTAPGPTFATGDGDTIEVRDAATGAVVRTVPDDGRAVVLAGGSVLVVTEHGNCSVELVGAEAPLGEDRAAHELPPERLLGREDLGERDGVGRDDVGGDAALARAVELPRPEQAAHPGDHQEEDQEPDHPRAARDAPVRRSSGHASTLPGARSGDRARRRCDAAGPGRRTKSRPDGGCVHRTDVVALRCVRRRRRQPRAGSNVPCLRARGGHP